MGERASVLTPLGVEADWFIATHYGGRLLTSEIWPAGVDPTALQDIIRNFALDPTACHEDIDERLVNIGNGKMSQLYALGSLAAGSLAIKVSTPETVNGLRTSEQPLEPEDLVTQVQFMSMLRHYLEENTAGTITAPRQYMAMHVLRNGQRHGLSVMENMYGWTNLEDLLFSNKYDDERGAAILRMVGNRILAATEDAPFAHILADLDLRATGSYAPGDQRPVVRGDNILAPPGTGVSGLETARLCLIDLPSPWLADAAGLAVQQFVDSGGYEPHYLI